MRHVIKPALRREPEAAGSLCLRISGFAGKAIAPAQVIAVLQEVPNFHLTGLCQIDCAIEEAVFQPKGLQAAFHQRERVIRFYRLPPWPLFRHVLLHEVGHYVYALVISSKVKTQWTGRAFRRSAPATHYGASGPEEDFAESYALYLSPDAADPAFAPKRAFMRDLVFSGDPWTLKEKQPL